MLSWKITTQHDKYLELLWVENMSLRLLRLTEAVNNILHQSSKSAAIFNRKARFDIKVELVEYLRAVYTNYASIPLFRTK